MKKILIATTNRGKFMEFAQEFADFKFDFTSLTDVGLDKQEVEEPFETTWENALQKAKLYAMKSGLLTIADDSGIFVDALNGYPGVHTKTVAPTPEARLEDIVKRLNGVPKKKRGASFKTSACVYDPENKCWSLFEGESRGLIAEKIMPTSNTGMEHDRIFYYPPAKKMFSEMTIAEKNLVSHRGKTIQAIRIYLSRQFGFRQIMVPIAIVAKDRKILLLQRRDHRKEFNGKWEFPGGGVEAGEDTETCLLREVKEETGYKVRIAARIPKIYSNTMGETKGNYQVFLPAYICTVQSGTFKTVDTETASHGWFTVREMLSMDLLPLNKSIIRDNIALIKEFID